MENKIFFGIGIITILSGIYLVIEGQYLAGVSGSFVGFWLAMDNYKKIKAKKSE